MLDEELTRRDCCFCAEFGSDPRTSPRSIVWNSGAVAFPSLGALRPGHLLVAPRAHFTSAALMPAGDRDCFIDVSRQARKHIIESYGARMIEFEHGMVDHTSGGCGIDHAQRHLLPWPQEQRLRDLLADDLELLPIHSDEDAAFCLPQGSSYLYLHDSDGVRYYALVPHLPSQFMRRKIAHLRSTTSWDWRTSPQNADFLETLARMRQRDAATCP